MPVNNECMICSSENDLEECQVCGNFVCINCIDSNICDECNDEEEVNE